MPQVFAKLSGVACEETLPESVASDVLALINASIRGGRFQGLHGSPAFSSVLNFGNAPLVCFGSGAVNLQLLVNSVKATILMFEPRLVPRSLHVEAVIVEGRGDSFRPYSQWPLFRIDGTLAGSEQPFRLHMRIDVAHGHACVDR